VRRRHVAHSSSRQDAKLGARLPTSIRLMSGFVSATSGRYAIREKYEPLGPDPARLAGRGRTHAECTAEYQGM